MRYLKHYFETIIGIEIYPIISLLIFFFFFVALGYYVIKMKKKHLEYMSNSPLELEEESLSTAHSEKG